MVSAGRPLTGGVSGYPILLRDTYSKGMLFVLTIPDDFGNLYDYPAGALNVIRRAMSKDVGAYIEGPAKVAFFPYDNQTMVVENFNDEAVSLRVVVNSKVTSLRNLLTDEQILPADLPKPAPSWGRNRFIGYPDGATVFDIFLPAHSYIGLGYGTQMCQSKLLGHETEIDKIIKDMTLEEKIDMLHGKNMFSSAGIPRLGLPSTYSASLLADVPMSI